MRPHADYHSCGELMCAVVGHGALFAVVLTDLYLTHPFQHNVLLLPFKQEMKVQSIGMWLGDNGIECEGSG